MRLLQTHLYQRLLPSGMFCAHRSPIPTTQQHHAVIHTMKAQARKVLLSTDNAIKAIDIQRAFPDGTITTNLLTRASAARNSFPDQAAIPMMPFFCRGGSCSGASNTPFEFVLPQRMPPLKYSALKCELLKMPSNQRILSWNFRKSRKICNKDVNSILMGCIITRLRPNKLMDYMDNNNILCITLYLTITRCI